ncbi:MAG: carboxylating nicotinate-nucleotide diphosphorylase [Flavobacteriaceae bacterium]|nr:carboxylating nicotinate-nucleotide diphosphorylase [Flavobacteriaceae bacterium]MDG1961463.1 carboxylating nicotinate-nucleotide diphosphorylase [Flavobacteriaceae bacterium]
MISDALFQKEIELIIANGLREDIGPGDHSSLACIPSRAEGKAQLFIKEDGYIAGIDFARQLFLSVDPNIVFNGLIQDGAYAESGAVAFEVEGASQSILRTERLALNAMQRMSGIATKTRAYVAKLQGTTAQLLDTRKTTPGIRALEKWAVRLGGGMNHRFALYDAIMLKDNHIDFCGGIAKAIIQTQSYLKTNGLELPLIVEARSLSEIEEILTQDDVTRILLDNFDLAQTKEAVSLINGQCQTESSGMITLETIRGYALCGVDFISCGAITHSVNNLDLSLKAAL